MAKHKYKIILIIIALILLVIFPCFIDNDLTPPMEAKVIHLEFSSDPTNLNLKNLNYNIFINNTSNQNLEYTLTIVRNDSPDYPYLDSIPEKYVTTSYSIDKNESKYIEITNSYLSDQNLNTSDSYDNFTIIIDYCSK